MSHKFPMFKHTSGAAFSDQRNNNEAIDWSSIIFQYPKNHGEYTDIKILSDVTDQEWHKNIVIHKFMRTADSYYLDEEDPNEKKQIKWLGSKRCSGYVDEHTIKCEYCKFLKEEQEKVIELLKKLISKNMIPDKYTDDMKDSDLIKLVCQIDVLAEKNPKLASLKGVGKRFKRLMQCNPKREKYLSVDNYNKGIKLLEMKGTIKKFIDTKKEEGKDITKLWIRIKNNKNAKDPTNYYIVFSSPMNEQSGETKPTEDQLRLMKESQIQTVYKRLLEEDDTERQIKNLAGDFGKEAEKVDSEDSKYDFSISEQEKKTPSSESKAVKNNEAEVDEVVNIDEDLDIDGILEDVVAQKTNNVKVSTKSVGKKTVEKNTVEKTTEQLDMDISDLDIDSFIEDIPNTSSAKKQEQKSKKVEEKQASVSVSETTSIDDDFNFDLDDDLQSIEDLIGD